MRVHVRRYRNALAATCTIGTHTPMVAAISLAARDYWNSSIRMRLVGSR